MRLTAHGTIVIVFAAFGAAAGVHVGALPFLIERAQVSPFVFGLAGTCAMAANILALGLGGVLNRHADHRRMLLMTIPALYGALWLALLAASPVTFVLSFMLLSFGLGTLDIFMNAEAAAVEQEVRRPVFGLYHGSVALAIAGFAILGSIVAAFNATWVCALVAGPALALAWVAVLKTIPPRATHKPDNIAGHAAMPQRLLTLLGLAAGFNVACEVAAMQWAGQLLVSIAPELAAISGLGVAFYGLCGGIMRLFGDRLRSAYGEARSLMVSISVAIAGFAVLGMAPGFWSSVIAFAAVGCGLSLTFPYVASLVGRLVPQARASAIGYVGAVSGGPRIAAPWILGALAAQFSLSAVFAALAIVAALALVIVIFTYARAEAMGGRATN